MVILANAVTYQFSGFLVDVRARALFRLDAMGVATRIPIGSRAFDILCALIERRGEYVSKQEMLDAIWPGVVVEENNLTVQMSALRRVLDVKGARESCIQTIPGRGYRLLPPVICSADTTIADAQADRLPASDKDEAPFAETVKGKNPALTDRPVARRLRPRRSLWAAALCGLAVALLVPIGWLAIRSSVGPTERPRLSIVVLPFENLSVDPGDYYLAEGITDDLTSDLARIRGATVIARESAYSYKGRSETVRRIGEELGVRYALKGSVRRIGEVLRVNVQLIAAETGATVWSDRFDERVSELAAGQEHIVTRMRAGVGVSLIEVEKVRSLRERPTNPDAFDFILRARALWNQGPSVQRRREACGMYDRALALESSSAFALTGVASCLLDQVNDINGLWDTFGNMQRAGQLLARARAIAPDWEGAQDSTLMWLASQGRCQEMMALAEQMIEKYPNFAAFYSYLGWCKVLTGHAEADIKLQQKAIQLSPRHPILYVRYRRLGMASLWLGRDYDAIAYLQQALARQPDDDPSRHWTLRLLAAAYALSGQFEDASRALAEADRLWPYDTVRSHFPDFALSHVFAEQIRRFQAGLRLAGERDHADEDADFHVPSDHALHSNLVGRTPKGAPGAVTVRTADLAALLSAAHPLVIDPMTNSWGRSMPGAVGLRFAGLGGSFTDAGQDRLRNKLRELTDGDLSRPIVAVGLNSERFDGRNLALRLVAMGYTHVYWYRGGREAWEVSNQPEMELTATDW